MELLAAVIGITIGLMLIANAALQQVLGPVTTLLVVHATGLLLVLPLAVLVRTKAAQWSNVPWPLFLGGLVGIALLLINNHTIPRLGAGLTVALGVVGQLLASAAVDHWGLFGLTRRRVCLAQVGGLVVAVGGVCLMTWGGS
jgi:transporter family-2 protein